MVVEGVNVDEGMDVNEGSSKTDFDAVKMYIETVVIKENKSCINEDFTDCVW